MFKIVLIGDGAVGKSSFIMKYIEGNFNVEYKATICDVYSDITTIMSDGQVQKIKLDFWDVAGQEDFVRHRREFYENADLFVLMFAIDRPASFRNLRDTWIPELLSATNPSGKTAFLPGSTGLDVPVLIVGTKLDARNYYAYYKLPQESNCISASQTQNLGKELGCRAIECSAYTDENIGKVVEAILETLNEFYLAKQRNKKCNIC